MAQQRGLMSSSCCIVLIDTYVVLSLDAQTTKFQGF